MTRTRANLLLLGAGAAWGLGFVAQSSAMAAIGPFLFIALRFTIAFFAMLPLAIREGASAERTLERRDWAVFAGIGAILFAGMTAQQTGLLTTSVTNSGFLTGLYLIMVPFLAVALFREWPHRVVWPSAATALFGIYLLSGGHLDKLASGDWLTILCALFWALQILFISRFANHTARPVTLSVVQFAATALLAAPFALLFEPLDGTAIVLAAPELLFAGVIAGGLAFTLQSVGQRHASAPQAAIILSSEALFAALFGALLLGERLSMMALFGCALIFAAMLAVELVPMLAKRTEQLTP